MTALPTACSAASLCAVCCCLRRTAGARRDRMRRRRRAIENSVVKIFATMRYPDPFKPWTKQAPSEVSASGVVIEGKRILTNAHVVLYASQVQIQANAAGDKLPATVVAVAPGIDLAVLKLDDASFFDTHPALIAGERAAADQGRGARLRFPDRRHLALDHQGHRLAHRVRGLQLSRLRASHPGRRRHQSGQQRRPGHRRRQDDRPRLLEAAAGTRRTSATSSPTRKSSCSSRTSPTDTTTASPPCTTSCRRSRTPRCAPT